MNSNQNGEQIAPQTTLIGDGGRQLKKSQGNPEEVLTVTEASEFLKVGEKTVYKLASCGMIPGRKVGREWRFIRSGLLKWLAEPEQKSCWELKGCSQEEREDCQVYQSTREPP